jgi:hypothetical protein
VSRQTGESEESTIRQPLDGPQPEPVSRPAGHEPIDELVARHTRQRRDEVLHDLRVGIQGGERVEVLVVPLAEAQACRRQPRNLMSGSHPDILADRLVCSEP